MSSMEQPNLRPTYGRDMESVWIEIRKLWKGIRQGDSSRLHDQVFSLPGSVYTVESGKWYLPNFGGRLVTANASLLVAGESNTVILIKKNGALITGGTITIPSASTFVVNQSVDEFYQADSDYVTVETTSAGAGAKFLTVQLRFKMG